MGVLVLSGGLLLSHPARAAVSVEHHADVDGCAQASAYFPEDLSVEATRARRQCRLETFERRLDEHRARAAVQSDKRQDQLLETWLERQEIPARVVHRNSIDFFLSNGLASYGLALGGLLFPWLEAEAWVGKRSVSESTSTGNFSDSRTCLGGRFKWLMRAHGNLTPSSSLGAADCSAHVQFDPYFFGGPVQPGGPPTSSAAGDGAAHLFMATAGVAWMEKSGFRVSLEYVFSYAFYTQATLNDQARTQDANLRAAWESRLTSDRHGVRLQVGYAF